MLVTALHFFQVTILNEYFNLSSQIATTLFIPTMIAMILFIPIIGKMLDKFQTHIIIGIALIVTGCSLLMITFASSLQNAIIYSVIFGINNAFSISLFGYIWARYFGRLHVGSIQGTGQMILVVGASIGPIPFAAAIDYLGDPISTIRICSLYPLMLIVEINLKLVGFNTLLDFFMILYSIITVSYTHLTLPTKLTV